MINNPLLATLKPVLFAFILGITQPIHAAVLTPMGAEANANADGSIPPWEGGLKTAPPGFDIAKGWKDPFENEKPLFVIDQTNLNQHLDFLTPGQIALLKKYPDYKIPVYPSHRTAVFSDGLMQAVKAEAGQAKLEHGGLAVKGLNRSMVPFTQPSNGLEAVWNTLLRRPSETLTSCTANFISGAQTEPVPVSTCQTIAWASALDKSDPDLLFALIGEVSRPASQAGEALLVFDTLNFKDSARQAWIVNSGQRRVLRAPELVHAAPAGNSDALRTVDDIYGFNGSPERFEWTLKGKRELYIPYNNYRLSNKSMSYREMLNGTFLKPELTRYEKHRVWVIEGTLKPGMEHIYSKRVMYVDEDSWYVALMDQYDTKGELWRVKALYLMQAYEAPGMYTAGEMQHDLNARKTIFSGFQNEEPPTLFNVPVRSTDFSQAALRRRMR